MSRTYEQLEPVISALDERIKKTGDEISELKEDLNAIFEPTKNLLDCTFANATFLDGVYTPSVLPTQAAEEEYIEVEASTEYVFSWNAVSSLYPVLYVIEYASDKTFIKYTNLSTRSYPTLTTASTTKYVRLHLYEANSQSWESLIPTDFQMEKGSTPTAYVPPKQIGNEYIGELPYIKDNQGAQNAGKALIVQNDGSVGLGTISGADASLAVKVSDIALMASINHSLRLPTDIAGVDVTDATDWVKADVTMSVVKNLYDPVNRIYRDCVSVKSTSNGIAYFNLGQSVDATKKPLLISIALDQSFNIENDRSVDIVLYSGSGRSSSYRAELYLQYADTNTSFNTAYCMNGFFNLCIFTDSGSYRSKGTYFDPTDVTAVGVHIYHATGTERTVYIADMKFVEPMKKPGLITIIDNFGTQVPAMADYAASKGVRLNLSIIPGFYEGSSSAPTCASKSELDRVAAQGHFIWNHTYEHLVFNNLTDKQIADEINLAEKWMYINGYGRGAKFVSVPSAKFNTDSFNSVVKTNANMIFHKWGYMGTWAYAPYYPCTRQIPTTDLDSATDHSASTLISMARKGLDNGGLSVIGFHGTYWDNDSGDSWKAYIDGISEIEGLYHYGLDEIFNGQWC